MVVRAIQNARESTADNVWSHVALIAILNIPMAESAMARALSDDNVWNWTMRQQILQYASGDPQYQYLRPRVVGFRPGDVVEKAEDFARGERAAFIFERHLAMALSEMGNQWLGDLGVNGKALIDRVSELEGTVTESLCFVLMPFRTALNKVYSMAIRPAVEAVGLRCERADEITSPGVILEQIDERIERAQVIVADLTGSNPNVAQELGYARALERLVILLAQKTESLPFDVRHFRVIKYEPDQSGLRSLRERLKLLLTETLGR